jgi:hypothetical protein
MRNRANPRMRGPQLSPAGVNFLKCAYASPDFNIDPGQGIPDLFNGKSLGRKDVISAPIAFTANTDTYLVVMPTPGVAYWTFSVAAGTALTSANTVLTPVLYPGFDTLFGAAATGQAERSTNVTAFRYASMTAGLYPTSNMMQFAGSIQVWKVPIRYTEEVRRRALQTTPVSSVDFTLPALAGFEGIGRVSNDNYSESFIKGCYTLSTNNGDDFEFREITDGIQSLPGGVGATAGDVTGTSMFGSLRLDTSTQSTPAGIPAGVGPVFFGFGEMDSIIIKVTSPTGAVNSAIFKTWACLEMKPNANSALYQYAGHSPDHDSNAIEMYRQVARRLPMAVPCEKNADFWLFVRNIIKSLAAVASYVPGPIGLVGAGIGGAIAGIEAMTI